MTDKWSGVLPEIERRRSEFRVIIKRGRKSMMRENQATDKNNHPSLGHLSTHGYKDVGEGLSGYERDRERTKFT